MAGEELNRRDKKPIEVVRAARRTGLKFFFRLVHIASGNESLLICKLCLKREIM
jgi:hypothetical protein